MSFKRRLSKKCIIIAIAILADMLPQMMVAYAEPETQADSVDSAITETDTDTQNGIVMATEPNQEVSGLEFLYRAAGVYTDLSGENCIFKDYDTTSPEDSLINAIALGLINISELEAYNGPITREDAMLILYRTVVALDNEYKLSTDEANYILNSCYDNAELKPEARVAYAFMIKHGFVTGLDDTNPTEKLQKTEVDSLFNKALSTFSQFATIEVGGNLVRVGETEAELVATLGAPDRVDTSEFGFSWYVYNKDPKNYISIGVSSGRVCAFFSNAPTIKFDKMESGSDITTDEEYAKTIGLKFFADADDKLNGVYYNKYESLTLTQEEYTAVSSAKAIELYDVICTDRAKRGLPTLELVNSIDKPNCTFAVEGSDMLEVYSQLDKLSGFNEATSDKKYAISIAQSIGEGERRFTVSVCDVDRIDKVVDTTSDYVVYDYTVSKPEVISAPVASLDKSVDLKSNDSDVIINLSSATSNKYLITIFDSEKNDYIVNQYVTTSQTQLVYPATLFTGGSTYTVRISAYDEEFNKLGDEERVDKQEFYEGNTITFDFGTPENPIRLVTPFNEGSTFDDELEVTIDSSVYHDFLVEIIDSNNNTVASKKLDGESFTVMDALPTGSYTVKATAYKRGTDFEVGTDSVKCTISDYQPEVEEFLLEQDAPYTYVYFTSDLKYLYTYQEELVTKDVETVTTQSEEYDEEISYTEDVDTTETVEQEESYTDENGNTAVRTVTIERPVTIQETRTRTETKTRDVEVKGTEQKIYKKIIRTKVPVTKKTLREANYSVEDWKKVSSGSTSEFGNAYAVLALSYQGVPYVWGGTTPNGFDCSGLVTYCAAQLGVQTHRVACDQFAYDGIPVSKEEMIPGDLIFFQDSTGYVHHVGIYIGNGMMVHAPHTGDVVRIASLDSSYYQREFAGAKRLIPQTTQNN